MTNNDDPEGMARVKVTFPWFSGDVESTWARLVATGAGPNCGLVWIPQVDDEVLVGFEHGDMRHPYVLGGLWNPVDPPPLGDEPVQGRQSVAQRDGLAEGPPDRVL